MTTTELITLEGDKPIYASQLNDNFTLLDGNITALTNSTDTRIQNINTTISSMSGDVANAAKKNAANTFTAANTFSGAVTCSGTTTLSGNVTISGSSFTFTRCTTKATTSSTASNGKVAVIVQNYRNGKSWYRVWSDGWIEQGGTAKNGTTVSLLKNFTTTDYNVQATKSVDTYASNFELLSVTDKGTSSFYLSQSGYTYGIYANWCARGY